MGRIAIVGTLDTKGAEHAFLAEILRSRGHEPLLVDVGTGGPPTVSPSLTRDDVAREAGVDLAPILARQDRGAAVAAMASAIPTALKRLAVSGEIAGVISLGGGGGTAIATAGMRALPIGFPKVMVSTLATANPAAYVGESDIVMIPSVVDIAGLNRVSRLVLTRAAGAICGMVEVSVDVAAGAAADRPVIAASMFGNTTTCVERARSVCEAAGYEVLVFHATGTGGRTMESLIASGVVAGVLDITTTEWADELVGGILSAGAKRLEAAASASVPAIVVPGCLDMVNFGAPETVPARFAGRTFYRHNPHVTLMRTTPEECAELGRIVAEKLNASRGPVTVLLPLRGISLISMKEGAFYNPDADHALFAALKSGLRPGIPVIECDNAINDAPFAERCAAELLKLMEVMA